MIRWVRLDARPLLLAVAVGFGLWILLQFLQRALWVLVLVLLALILAAVIMPIVRLLQSPRLPPRGWRLPKALAVVVIYLAVAGALALVGYLGGRLLVDELLRFVDVLPDVATDLGVRLNEMERATGLPSGLIPSAEDLASQSRTLAAGIADATGRIVGGLIGLVFQFFVVLTLALFLVVESERILAFWVSLFPPPRRDRVRELTTRIGDKIARWMLGRIAVAVIVGTLAALAAMLLGLPYPVLIGAVTALLELAPVLGPTLMVIPAFLLGLSQSPVTAILAALVFLALAQIDGNVLSPLIEGGAIQLSPSLIIIAVPLGLALYGPIGALLAIPVTAALQVLTQEVFLPWLHSQQEVLQVDTGSKEAKETPPEEQGPQVA